MVRLTEYLLRRDSVVLISLIGFLFVLAGLYTVFGVGMRMSALDMTAMRDMRDMPGPIPEWSVLYAVIVFLMWWVMMTAMMIPSAAPTILLFSALSKHGSSAASTSWTPAAFLSGYLIAWAGFSAIAASAQWAAEWSGLVSGTMLTLIDSAPGAAVLILAGVYQFTPLKKACLQHCRSPQNFIATRRRSGISGALLMGIEHGTFCLGCCWSLMALLFVGGVMNLYWIVGLAAFVALEKLAPFGEVLRKGAGLGLIFSGCYVLLMG